MGAQTFCGPGVGIGFGIGSGFGIGLGFGGAPINILGVPMGIGGGCGIGFGMGYGFGFAKGAKLLTNTMPGFSDPHEKQKLNPLQQMQRKFQDFLPKPERQSSSAKL